MMRHLPPLRALAVIAIVAVSGCNKNVDEGATMVMKEQPPNPHAASSSPHGQAARPEQGSPGPAITGSIRIAPALTAQLTGRETLYIMARQSKDGPPMAVQRVPSPSFPFSFRLTARDVMFQDGAFEGEFFVSIRVDKDGLVGPAAPGDMLGSTDGPVPVGGPAVELLIEHMVP